MQTERHDPAVEVAAELRNIFVVGVQHGDAAGVQRLDQLILGARDCGDGFEELQMNGRDHGHHAAIRLRQPGQRSNFARVRHPHLDDCDLVLGLQLQQLQRHAEVVVQIALRLQHMMARSQHVRDGFFGSGFPG